jgi:phage terminase large subunit
LLDRDLKDGSPVISDKIIQEERDSGMPEEMIEQEYKCSFEAPCVGAYYGAQMMWLEQNGRITNVPYDPLLPVDTWWDIGVADSTAIWFSQQYGMEIRIIDYYESSGEGISHYAGQLRDRGYNYGVHIAPHDIEVREFSSDGKSRRDVAKKHGIHFKVCPKHEVMDGIEAVRGMLPLCWIDAIKCGRGIEALRQYRKEWDDKNKCYKDHPLHDWTSHGADGFRIGAMGGRILSRKRTRGDRQETDIDEHEYV